MVQMWETGANSPDISCDFQLVLRGRLVAAPTNGVCHKQQFFVPSYWSWDCAEAMGSARIDVYLREWTLGAIDRIPEGVVQ